MGNRYVVTRHKTALSTTNDILTLKAAASRRLRVIEVEVAGMGTASAANELMISRVTTIGVTAGGEITPIKATHADQPAAAFTAPTTWGTQPVVDTNGPVHRLGVNANGGINRWVPLEAHRPEIRDSAELSFRSAFGTSEVSITVVVEED